MTCADQPTFCRDVAPILFQHCAVCHREGEIAPFSLFTYQDARRRAKQIALVVGRKLMPPWKPERGADAFRHARQLSDEQIETLSRWAASDRPEGDVADLPAKPEFPSGWHAGEPDMIVEVQRPFTVPAEGEDIYIHFVMPLALKNDRYVEAVQVLPSNRRVAHHGVIILDTRGEAQKLAREAEGDRYVRFGGPGFLPAGFLPGYAPGTVTRRNDEDDTAIHLPKEADLVLQMHYHPIGREESDQPKIGIYFADRKPQRNPALILMANNEVDIPAGEADFSRTDTFRLVCDFEVRTVWAHMHLIGREVHSWAELPNGDKRELLRIVDWDFNWQDTYEYVAPFVLPAGTTVRTTWRWDNTSSNPRNPYEPPQRITWGPSSNDEMSGLIVGGVTRDPRHEGPFWLSVLSHYLHVEGRAHAAAEKRAKSQ